MKVAWQEREEGRKRLTWSSSSRHRGRRFLFHPILHNLIPGEVMSNPIQGSQFGLLAVHEEATMLETDDIPAFRMPSLLEQAGTRHCGKDYSIRPYTDKTERLWWASPVVKEDIYINSPSFYLQFTFPVQAHLPNNSSLSVSEFLF